MLRMSIGNVYASYYCTCHHINNFLYKLYTKIITDLQFCLLMCCFYYDYV